MANEAAKKEQCTICDKVGLKPFTKQNIFNYYLPLHGLASYAGLSVAVLNPSLVTKYLPNKPGMLNVLLLSSLTGTAFYLYGRPHMRAIPNAKRGGYAVLGGSLFTMGSVLIWSVLKNFLPQDQEAVATVLGLCTGAVIVKLSTDYINDSDKLVVAKNN